MGMLVQLGLLTVQSIKRDRAKITNDRCWILDKQQGHVLKNIVNDHKDHAGGNYKDLKFENVFLYGQQGTGKTFLLLEIAKMRVAHYMVHDEEKKVLLII